MLCLPNLFLLLVVWISTHFFLAKPLWMQGAFGISIRSDAKAGKRNVLRDAIWELWVQMVLSWCHGQNMITVVVLARWGRRFLGLHHLTWVASYLELWSRRAFSTTDQLYAVLFSSSCVFIHFIDSQIFTVICCSAIVKFMFWDVCLCNSGSGCCCPLESSCRLAVLGRYLPNACGIASVLWSLCHDFNTKLLRSDVPHVLFSSRSECWQRGKEFPHMFFISVACLCASSRSSSHMFSVASFENSPVRPSHSSARPDLRACLDQMHFESFWNVSIRFNKFNTIL